MKLATFNKMLVSLSLFVCASLSAAPLTVDVTGIQSYGGFGNAGNTVLTYDVGANAHITSVSYSVGLSAFGPSWLSEISLAFTDLLNTGGVFLRPGFLDSNPGTGVYSNTADLIGLGLDFTVGADGILRLEFFEGFDDFLGVDGQWDFGTITFGIETGEIPGEVPEPATGLLLGAGLAMLGYSQRRRRQAAMH